MEGERTEREMVEEVSEIISSPNFIQGVKNVSDSFFREVNFDYYSAKLRQLNIRYESKDINFAEWTFLVQQVNVELWVNIKMSLLNIAVDEFLKVPGFFHLLEILDYLILKIIKGAENTISASKSISKKIISSIKKPVHDSKSEIVEPEVQEPSIKEETAMQNWLRSFYKDHIYPSVRELKSDYKRYRSYGDTMSLGKFDTARQKKEITLIGLSLRLIRTVLLLITRLTYALNRFIAKGSMPFLEKVFPRLVSFLDDIVRVSKNLVELESSSLRSIHVINIGTSDEKQQIQNAIDIISKNDEDTYKLLGDEPTQGITPNP